MKKSIKYKVLSIKGSLVGFFLLTTYYLLLTTNVYASHLPAEGWACIENSIYYQNPEGVDEILKDCQVNEVCQNISILDFISDAKCVDEQPSVVLPDDTPQTTSPSPSTTSTGVTSEEQAIYNLNKGLLPSQVLKGGQERSKNFLEQVKDFLGGIFSGLFWNPNPPNTPDKLYMQSESLHQAEIPQNLEEGSQSENVQGIKEDFEANLKGFLGGSAGFYGASLPKFGNNNDIKSSECLFENASFPAGINPVTGREC